MQHLSTEYARKMQHLRHKLESQGSKRDIETFERIVWYSQPIVYPSCERDLKVAHHEIAKTRARRKRWYSYIRDMAKTFTRYPMYLLSLTFNDESYNALSDETKQRYVKDYLNKVCCDWFACADIGKKNGRLHYHAVCILSDRIPIIEEKHRRRVFYRITDSEQEWKYGFYSFRRVKSDDEVKTVRYACKCADYAFKSEGNGIKPFHARCVHRRDTSSANPAFYDVPAEQELPF